MILAAAFSAIGLVLAVRSWRDPVDGTLAQGTDLATTLLWSARVTTAVTGLAAIVGLLGIAICAVRLRRDAHASPGRPLLVLAVLELAVFGLALGSVSAITLAGYLMAMAMPVLLTVLLVQVIRRYAVLRWIALGLFGCFVLWGLFTGALRAGNLITLGANLIGGFAQSSAKLLLTLVLLAATAAWGLVLLGVVRGTPVLTGVRVFVLGHRRSWTITAALCTLPYGLIRLTWLTPWSLLAPGSEAISADIRLWGLMLGSASLLGFVLTLGLIRPWGERFPRWMPWLAGRPVPIAAVAVPGGLVATIVCVSAAPMAIGLTFTTGGAALGVRTILQRALAIWIFPFWLWGPMLAMAVWGYVLYRGQAAPSRIEVAEAHRG